MCLIPKGYEIELFESPDFNTVRFLFVGLDEERSLRKEGGYTRRIARLHFLDAAARTKKRENRFRRKTGDLHTRVAKCIEVDIGVFKHYFEL
jgi:hypothetical protein